MRLTAKFVREVEPPERSVARYSDGNGLMLVVQASGSKSYIQRLSIHGKRHDIGLGSVRWISLTEARKVATDNWKLARMGGDPLAAKRTAPPTFAEAAETVIELHSATWRDGAKSADQWRASLQAYAMQRLGGMTVDRIATADVLACLVPIWNEKRETARRVRQRIGAVMKWAIAEGHRTDNPAGDAITAALPRNGIKQAHQRALPYEDVADAVETLRKSAAYPTTTLAFEFLVLTAARSGEVRGATWAEIDFEAATWTIPGDRMKAGAEHRVPLSDAAMAVLEEARTLNDGSGLIFPSVRGIAMSDSTLSKLMREHNIEAVPHGFRSSFRQWAAERTNAPREVAEAALAHVVSNKVEAAYQRSDLFERRRALMQQWANYLAAESAKVGAIRRA